MDIFDLFFRRKTSIVSEQNISTLIGEGCVITGDVKSKNSIRIDGRVDGNVIVEQELTVGDKGVINGDVKTQDVLVYGLINGSVDSKKLNLKPKGKIKGSITTQNIHMEPGAIYNGTLSMLSENDKFEDKFEDQLDDK